jgi:hypothetical protein
METLTLHNPENYIRLQATMDAANGDNPRPTPSALLARNRWSVLLQCRKKEVLA